VQFCSELDIMSVGVVNSAVAAAGLESDERRAGWAENSPELPRNCRQRCPGGVDDRIPGKYAVGSRIGCRQVGQLSHFKAETGMELLRDPDHLGRQVHTCDVQSRAGQVFAHPTGAASGVDH
jgi:hypothetical protein